MRRASAGFVVAFAVVAVLAAPARAADDDARAAHDYLLSCAGCHTLNAANATGTTGPSLDQLASALTLAIVTKQVTNGGSIMPAFKGTLTAAQIKAVAKYVVSVAGK